MTKNSSGKETTTRSTDSSKKPQSVVHSSGVDDPRELIDMQGDSTFAERHPNDASIADIQADRLKAMEEQLEKNVKNGSSRAVEAGKLQDAFRRLELADLSLLENVERRERLARKFETMGVVQALEAVGALLLSSGMNGIPQAGQKIASAVRILKEQNGIPLSPANPKAPLGEEA